MTLKAGRVELQEIMALRALFLQETNFQIRYNATHERGWTDSYLLTDGDLRVGYGSIKGQENLEDRNTVFEFYVIPSYRRSASLLFRELIEASAATYIECQSNDLLLSAMLFEFAPNVRASTILFEDHAVTQHELKEAIVRRRREGDQVFNHEVEPVGDFVLTMHDDVVATGGFMLHYNKPFADLYMEVRTDCRMRGYGTYLLQEVKKECYLAGRVPAARCDIRNAGSRGALTKAGLRVSGFMLLGLCRPGGE